MSSMSDAKWNETEWTRATELKRRNAEERFFFQMILEVGKEEMLVKKVYNCPSSEVTANGHVFFSP